MNDTPPAKLRRVTIDLDGAARPVGLPKAPTGIIGLDEVTLGGFPRERATLVCGPAGCGKTMLATEFIVRGITEFNEPGVFVAFEETAAALTVNIASLGFDLAQLEADRQLVIDHIGPIEGHLDGSGEWDLGGLFIRLGVAIDAVGAKRVAIDSIETLFGAFTNTSVLRTELQRLFGWLNARGVTSVITGERGDGTLTRYGIEEYVSDCVIVLDNRVTEQMSTRRLRILKYRGSLHGTNEFPFLIGESGIFVYPVTSHALQHSVTSNRVSSGVAHLDAMLDDGGFYRGSTVLVSGTSGTGKSTLAAQFCVAACARGERVLYYAFEESPQEIIRNMESVGIDLRSGIDAGLLRLECFRPSLMGLESHLFSMQKLVREFQPQIVVKDPISDLFRFGSPVDVSALLTHEVDFLKAAGVTAMFTSLVSDLATSRGNLEITSLIDTWVLMQTVEGNGEHNRMLSVLKSRGMAHSNQMREFLLTDAGIEIADVYVGAQGVLTGSARQAQEAKERSDDAAGVVAVAQRRAELTRLRQSVSMQVAELWRQFEQAADAVERLAANDSTIVLDRAGQRAKQGSLRGGAGSVAEFGVVGVDPHSVGVQ